MSSPSPVRDIIGEHDLCNLKSSRTKTRIFYIDAAKDVVAITVTQNPQNHPQGGARAGDAWWGTTGLYDRLCFCTKELIAVSASVCGEDTPVMKGLGSRVEFTLSGGHAPLVLRQVAAEQADAIIGWACQIVAKNINQH